VVPFLQRRRVELEAEGRRGQDLHRLRPTVEVHLDADGRFGRTGALSTHDRFPPHAESSRVSNFSFPGQPGAAGPATSCEPRGTCHGRRGTARSVERRRSIDRRRRSTMAVVYRQPNRMVHPIELLRCLRCRARPFRSARVVIACEGCPPAPWHRHERDRVAPAARPAGAYPTGRTSRRGKCPSAQDPYWRPRETRTEPRAPPVSIPGGGGGILRQERMRRHPALPAVLGRHRRVPPLDLIDARHPGAPGARTRHTRV
jgi:hypothetical protein